MTPATAKGDLAMRIAAHSPHSGTVNIDFTLAASQIRLLEAARTDRKRESDAQLSKFKVTREVTQVWFLDKSAGNGNASVNFKTFATETESRKFMDEQGLTSGVDAITYRPFHMMNQGDLRYGEDYRPEDF